MTPHNITRQYKDTRVIGDIRKRMPNKKRTLSRKKMPSRKTFINSYSKLKTRIIKN